VTVLPFDGDSTFDNVPLEDVIESIDLEGEDITAGTLTTAALQDPEKLKEYYAQIYGGQPEYYTKLCKIIDESAAL
jgi:hypothetical protein